MSSSGWRPVTPGADQPDFAELTGGWPAHRPPPGGRSFKLFLSPDGSTAEAALFAEVVERGAAAVAPAGVPPEDLALALHGMEPPPAEAEAVVLTDFHAAFPLRLPEAGAGAPPPPPTIAAPGYVTARLVQLLGGQCDLLLAAREDELVLRASDLLAGRGAACSLEVRREDVPPPALDSVPSASEGTDTPRTPAALRRKALHAPTLRARGEAAEAAVAAEPENAVGHLLAGCASLEAKQPAAAAESFRRAVECDDTLAAAHFELGKVMIVLDDLEAALASFRRTTEVLPDFASGWANAGAALGELERPEEALPALERAVELDPLSHSLASNLGVTLRDLGRLEEAEARFRGALELAPDFVFGHYNLANAVYLQGRHQEAVELFEKAQRLDPSGSDRQRLLLAAARLAAGDEEGALDGYREVFASLQGQMRLDMRTVAQWDLRRLAERTGISPGLRRAAEFVRDVTA